MSSDLRIRAMRPDEIDLALDWAAAEGWNPGLADAACFAGVDPEGFLIGELDGAPVATISCVAYDEQFAFLGFYLVRPELRGRGYGLRMWQAAMAHAGSRTVGLDLLTRYFSELSRLFAGLEMKLLRGTAEDVVELLKKNTAR